ncbi:DMT family transporter [Nocardiopsis sp. SBT366]|uniref:DMT family transporter n=1 Tax=Nocardiopsis sp. SBT366 TaxID=1580529 RepID=UPI00066AD471|nr:DMT family transporter [Nocardiopsis sp. SBT366]
MSRPTGATPSLTASLAAMAATVVLWAGFALSIRGIGASDLTATDAALLRFLTPLVVLAPWIPRAVRRVRHERPGVLLALCVGAGLPYFLLAAWGGSLTSAALVGIVIPGTVPLFVTALAFALWRTRARPARLGALVLIVLGAAVPVAAAVTPDQATGVAILLCAGLVWSVYTLALRETTLDPVSAAIVLCAPSALLAGIPVLLGLAPSALLAGAASRDVLLYVAVQGIGVGVLAALCYATAIRGLGGPAAATLGALSPVVTLLAAVPLFGEPVTLTTTVTLLLVLTGVIAFNLLGAGRPTGTPPPSTPPLAHPSPPSTLEAVDRRPELETSC